MREAQELRCAQCGREIPTPDLRLTVQDHDEPVPRVYCTEQCLRAGGLQRLTVRGF